MNIAFLKAVTLVLCLLMSYSNVQALSTEERLPPYSQADSTYDLPRFGVFVSCQQDPRRNDFGSVWYDLNETGSINLEFFLGRKRNNIIRAGFYYTSPNYTNGTHYDAAFPATWSYVFRTDRIHQFEIGLGAVLTAELWRWDAGVAIHRFIVPIMYRFQDRNKWFIRTGIIVNIAREEQLIPTLCIGRKIGRGL